MEKLDDLDDEKIQEKSMLMRIFLVLVSLVIGYFLAKISIFLPIVLIFFLLLL